MSNNSNGKYFFYSVVVLTVAALFVWASSRYAISDVLVAVVFIASMTFLFWVVKDSF